MIKQLNQQVESTLKNYPETRNSDIALTIKIWQLYYGIGNEVELKKLYELPREDNVKRVRAKFCELGMAWSYPTEWKVAKGRKIKEDEWRVKLGYAILPSEKRFSYFEKSDRTVAKVPEDKEEEFLKLNPNATKLS